jgi:hypothetical protein
MVWIGMQGRSLGMPQVALLGVAGVGAVAGAAVGTWPGLLGMLCLLGWAAAEAGKAAWQAIKAQPDAARPRLGEASLRLSATYSPIMLSWHREGYTQGMRNQQAFLWLQDSRQHSCWAARRRRRPK